MATRKKELLEQETAHMEGTPPMGAEMAENEPFLGNTVALPESTADSADETGGNLDLNELLENMDQEADTEGIGEGEESLPEFAETDMPDALPSTGVFGNPESMALPETEISAEENPNSPESPTAETAPVRPKRSSRKKKTEPGAEETAASADTETAEMEIPGNGTDDISSGDTFSATPLPAADSSAAAECGTPAALTQRTSEMPDPRRPDRIRNVNAAILTIENRGEVETAETREDTVWHEIHNAYRTRRILTGQLGGIEQTDTGKTIAIVDYKGFRIVIPLKEMMINLGRSPSGQEYTELMLRQNKILGNMLGAEIDFIVRGIDSKSRSVVASRREAMLKKRQIFYLDTDASDMYRIYDGRIVQARVIAVAEKVIRVEVFGVECSIMARDLAWDWIGDAHERFSVGDQVLVRILNVRRDSLEDIGIRADIKSVSQNTNHENLKKCRIQSKYAGKVTDVHKGVVYIRLSNGVNAVAHSCYDYRTPGKKDDVSFAVTRIDEERGVAVGIITRIIRQNL